MPIRFLCYNCAAKIKVPDGTQGRKVKCPSCGSLQRVPAQTSEMTAPTASPPAAPSPAEETPAPSKRKASQPPPEPPAPPAPEPVEQAPAPSPVEESLSSAPYELVSDEPSSPSSDAPDADALDPLAALAAAAGGDGPPAQDPVDSPAEDFSLKADDEPATDQLQQKDDQQEDDQQEDEEDENEQDQDDQSEEDEARSSQPDEAAAPDLAAAMETYEAQSPAEQTDASHREHDQADSTAGDAPSAEESPALPWTDINEAASQPVEGDETDQPADASADEPSADEQPTSPRREQRPGSPIPAPAASQSKRANRPDQPTRDQAPAATHDDAADDAGPAVDDAAQQESSQEEGSDAFDAGLAAAAAAGAGAAAVNPQPRPAPPTPKAIPLGHASSFRSTMARPQPVTGNAEVPGGSSATLRSSQLPPPAQLRGQSAASTGGSSALTPRPLYRSLKLASIILNILALLLVGVTVLQAVSWQRGSLPGVLGDSGYKLIYTLQVAIPLALAGLSWGLAQCATGLRDLLRR